MLANILHKVAEQFEEVKHKYRPRPSLADPEKCLRQLVYYGLNVPREPLPGRALIVFDDSNFGEEICLDLLRKTAYKVHSEQMRINCPPPIASGSIDGVITDIMKKDYLLEIKNLSHFGFEGLWAGRIPVGYFNQMACYFWGLQEVQPEITDGILLVKNKNQGQFLEFLVGYDKAKDIFSVSKMIKSTGEEKQLVLVYPDILKKACDRFRLIQDYIDRKTLPKREYEQKDWQCEYCGYFTMCWKGYEEEFEGLATKVDLPELEELAGYYLESSMHETEMRKEKEKLKKQIKDALKAKDARQCKSGRYVIKNELRRTESLDKKLIPVEVKEKATKVTQYEQISIRLSPEAKAKKEKEENK